MIRLRLTPPRNNQRACVNLAEDYAFDGAIAQLGERRAGSAKVVGSSPTSSTAPFESAITVGSNPFRDHLGTWMDRVAGGEDVIITRRGRPRIRMSRPETYRVVPLASAGVLDELRVAMGDPHAIRLATDADVPSIERLVESAYRGEPSAVAGRPSHT